MAFDSLASFWAMGNYGTYVWSAYGFSLLALIYVTANSWLQARQVRKRLRKKYLRDKRD